MTDNDDETVFADYAPLDLEVGETESEALIQITSFAVRFSLARQISQFARDNGMSTGALLLGALRDKYPQLDIQDADIRQRQG